MSIPAILRLLPVLVALAGAARAGVTLREDAGVVAVEIDGKPFTELRQDGRFPYLYPLLSSAGGDVTRHFPMRDGVANEPTDHPHHRSCWVAHGDVNGVDFWQGDGRILVQQVLTAEGGAARGTLKLALAWKTKDDVVLLEETRSYTFCAVDAATRAIEVDCELRAAVDKVTFGDTKEGTFALRLTPSLQLTGKAAKGTLVTSAGARDAKAWGTRADWAAFCGPDAAGRPLAVIIADHPQNPRHPTWWHARDYGLFSANPFGEHDFEKGKPAGSGNLTLAKGESVRFRHRITIHSGSPTPEELTKLAAWPAAN